MDNDSIFGRYTDKEEGNKSPTLTCRVSKETKKLFEAHAKSKFGNVSNGLREILFDYMSQYPFRRQILNVGEINIFVPVFNDDGAIYLPYDFHVDLFDFLPHDLEDINDVFVSDYHVESYVGVDSSDYPVGDIYHDVAHWIDKESDYNLDEGVIIGCNINNYLDKNIDGMYRGIEEIDNFHRGLSIFKFEEKYYYIILDFEINRRDEVIMPTPPYLVSNEEAYKMAIECDNIELANFIDNLNEGISNIEKDKQGLINKKEYHLHQIKKIDEKLSKL